MIVFLRHLFGWILSTFGSCKNLVLENLALRQQLLVFHSKRPRRRFSTTQKLFWVVLRRFWSGWQKPLVLITPRTVIEWHRAGFRLYWKCLSRARRLGGRKPLGKEIRAGGKPDLGSAPYPWRIIEARIQGFGANRLTLASASPSQPRRGRAMADILAKSTRRDCGHGLPSRGDPGWL